MSMHAGPARTPLTLEHAGRTYSVRPIDRDFLGRWETALAERAYKAVAVIKGGLEPEEYRRRLDKVAADFEDGVFSLLSPHSVEALKRTPVMLLLAQLLLGVDSAVELAELMRHKGDEVQHLCRVMIAECMGAQDGSG